MIFLRLNAFVFLLSCTFLHLAHSNELPKLIWDKERFEENYREFINHQQSLPLWKQPISSIPLIIGGGVRLNYQHNDVMFDDELAYEELYLRRYNIHLDWYMSENFRLFTQLNYADDFKANDFVSPVEKNDLEFHQVIMQYNNQQSDIRLGRQEIVLNGQTLFGAREGTNVRRSHVAAWLKHQFQTFSMSFIVGTPIKNKRGSWEDEINHQERYYWLNINKDALDATYVFYKDDNPMVGDSSSYRNMLILTDEFDLLGGDVKQEVFVQWGQNAKQDILAWRYVNEYSHDLTVNSGINVTVDISSGGQSSKKIKTFDPMYMRGDLLSELSTFTASNLVSLHPTYEYKYSQSLEIVLESTFYWRYRDNDSLYGPSRFVEIPQTWRGRYIGSAVAIVGELEIDDRFEVEVSLGRMFFDNNLRDIGLNHISQLELTLSANF